eukprot:TCONS_00056645-protein
MKDLFSVDFRDAIRKVVRSELKEKFGIKIHKEKHKGTSSSTTTCQSKYFGVPLEDVPSKSVKDDQYFRIPIFLADSLDYLNHHVKIEGLFRKSGSVGRQKTLRELLEKDGTCCSCEFVQPHDIASLVKQFFRELPDPLLTRRYCPAFLKCISLNNTNDCIPALALCCLLLPDEHLRVLKYFVQFISEMANHSLESKMTLSNLAIIFAPNLTASSSSKEKNGEKTLKDFTQIVDLLFKNAHLIGMVPDALFNKALTMNQEGGFCSSSGDELDVATDEHPGRGRNLQRSDKKRDRSKSITGFLRRNFKANEKTEKSSSSTNKHARSRTCEKPSTSKEDLLQIPTRTDSIKEFGEPVWRNQHSEKPNTKRRNNSKTNMSPVRKSPRLSAREVHHATPPVISLAKLKSVSNQVASTPRRLLQPIHGNQDRERVARALPSLPSRYGPPISSTALKTKVTKTDENQIPKIPPPTKPKPRLTRSKSSTLHHSSGNNSIISQSSEKMTIFATVTATTTDNNVETTTQQRQPVQPKLSRATQKPHVRKNRRQSSLDRRRARYASASQRIRRPKVSTSQKSLTDSNLSNQSISMEEVWSASSGFDDDTKDRAFVENQSAALPPIATLDLSTTENHTPKPRTARRRLPKASSSTACCNDLFDT